MLKQELYKVEYSYGKRYGKENIPWTDVEEININDPPTPHIIKPRTSRELLESVVRRTRTALREGVIDFSIKCSYREPQKTFRFFAYPETTAKLIVVTIPSFGVISTVGREQCEFTPDGYSLNYQRWSTFTANFWFTAKIGVTPAKTCAAAIQRLRYLIDRNRQIVAARYELTLSDGKHVVRNFEREV